MAVGGFSHSKDLRGRGGALRAKEPKIVFIWYGLHIYTEFTIYLRAQPLIASQMSLADTYCPHSLQMHQTILTKRWFETNAGNNVYVCKSCGKHNLLFLASHVNPFHQTYIPSLWLLDELHHVWRMVKASCSFAHNATLYPLNIFPPAIIASWSGAVDN